MKTIYDIQQLLKRFGSYIYLGDRMADLELMEIELKELYSSKLIETADFQSGIMLLRHEIRLEREKKTNRN